MTETCVGRVMEITEITQEVSFGRRDHHLHLCPRSVGCSFTSQPSWMRGNRVTLFPSCSAHAQSILLGPSTRSIPPLSHLIPSLCLCETDSKAMHSNQLTCPGWSILCPVRVLFEKRPVEEMTQT